MVRSSSGTADRAESRPVVSAVTEEEEQLLRSIGLGDVLNDGVSSSSSDGGGGKIGIHPALAFGLGAAFVLNLGVVLSLPPVIRGRGAPYLPTFGNSLDAMFRAIRRRYSGGAASVASRGQRTATTTTTTETPMTMPMPLRFVDLGSGDGRVVFRAAREGLFGRGCVGYEINPVLHAFASFRRLVQAPTYWRSTSFALRDLWKVDLRDADVVAVYGLQPIMKDLGAKMRSELRPGAVVVSNVFAIPGWRSNGGGLDGVHLYEVPDCWQKAPAHEGGGQRTT